MSNSKELQEFEDQIFDKEKNPNVKYNVDQTIEASVKYDFLIENYGKEKVDALVPDFHQLYDFPYFQEIHNKLENQK